jgi:hypothetical protein
MELLHTNVKLRKRMSSGQVLGVNDAMSQNSKNEKRNLENEIYLDLKIWQILKKEDELKLMTQIYGSV